MEYGICYRCGSPLQPVFFTEAERDSHGILTGRVRKACSHLLCERCGCTEVVDNTFDGPWTKK